MKSAFKYLTLTGFLLIGGLAKADFAKKIYDVNNNEISSGSRVAGYICVDYDQNRNPEFINHPELIPQYVQENLPTKYMIVYWDEGSGQQIVVNPPFNVSLRPGTEVFHRRNSYSWPEKAIATTLKGISLGAVSGTEYHEQTIYQTCVSIEGTYDTRSSWQRFKDNFR